MAVLAQGLLAPWAEVKPSPQGHSTELLVQKSFVCGRAVGNVLQQLSTPTLESPSELFLTGHGKSLRANSLFANLKNHVLC